MSCRYPPPTARLRTISRQIRRLIVKMYMDYIKFQDLISYFNVEYIKEI